MPNNTVSGLRLKLVNQQNNVTFVEFTKCKEIIGDAKNLPRGSLANNF